MRLIKTPKLLMLVALGLATQWVSAKEVEKDKVDVEEMSVETFFRNPEFASLSLSPDGKYLKAMAPYKQRMNLYILDIDNNMKKTQATGVTSQDIAGGGFVNNERLVFTMDKDGNEDFGLYATNWDGSKPRTLVDPGRFRSASILHRLPEDDEHVLITYNKTRFAYPDVFKMNVNTGKMKKIVDNPGYATGWMADHNGVVRIANEVVETKTRILYRSDENSDWVTLDEFDVLESGFNPVAFDYDNKTLFVQSNIGRNTAALYKYDPEKKQMGELIYEDDTYDVGGPVLSDHLKKLVGVSIEREKPETIWLEPGWSEVQATLDQAIPGMMNTVVSTSDDESRMVVLSWSDTDPGTYYLLDRKENKLRHLVRGRSWIKPEQMAEMKPIKYKARDGLTIHGYLTLPKNYDGKAKLPLIINPHGGPQARDSWRFNSEHQFFANRGYAVLQVNFRGSTGYGSRHLVAGYKEWGNKMQNDITDGVNWAVSEGYADPERVCIYGASYGGYATMAGLTFTPDVYKCGINYVGVTDVAMLFDTAPKAWEGFKKQMMHQIGDPKDREFMQKISPVHHVANIEAPLMIVHGKRDPRVVIDHAYDLKDEMEKHDKYYEWLVEAKEGHGFRKEENAINLYKKMDVFLKKYL